MQTSLGHGNGNGNGNGWRMLRRGRGLGRGHRPTVHTRLDLSGPRGRQLPPHPESHPVLAVHGRARPPQGEARRDQRGRMSSTPRVRRRGRGVSGEALGKATARPKERPPTRTSKPSRGMGATVAGVNGIRAW